MLFDASIDLKLSANPGFSIFKESNLLGTTGKNTTKMPRLLDMTNKTPYINHNMPGSPAGGHGGAFGSPLKAPFQLSSNVEVPETIIRPSRARTSLRMPRISGSGGGGGLPPVTPAPEGRGKHWEILSDGGDLSVDEVSPEELQVPSIPLDDEIEYMPPPVKGASSSLMCYYVLTENTLFFLYRAAL